MAMNQVHLDQAHLQGLRPVRHHYVSVGCIHDEHGDCKIECYYCGQICHCDCHLLSDDTYAARQDQARNGLDHH